MTNYRMEKLFTAEWIIISRICRFRDYWRKKGISSHVLMFHDVYIEKDRTSESNYAISAEEIEKIIIWHNNRKYEFISVDDMLDKSPLPSRQCIITFDDGKNNIEFALPILHKYKIPFCIYIITSKIGEEGYLTEKQLRSLSKDPLCTIGSHTHTHPYTRYLNKVQLLEEMTTSKECLEKILEKEVSHFAFPYGTVISSSYFDSRYVQQAGYKSAAFTTQIPLSSKKIYPFHIPRFDASRKNILEVL